MAVSKIEAGIVKQVLAVPAAASGSVTGLNLSEYDFIVFHFWAFFNSSSITSAVTVSRKEVSENNSSMFRITTYLAALVGLQLTNRSSSGFSFELAEINGPSGWSNRLYSIEGIKIN